MPCDLRNAIARLRFRRCEIYIRCGFEAIHRLRVGRQWFVHDVCYVFDVIDLIHAGFYAFVGVHAFGDVAGDGHAEAMGFRCYRFDVGEFHGAVDFYLLKT